jgi:hypothetical protein
MEDLLERAEFVFIGKVSRVGTNAVTVETTEILRASTNNAPQAFEWQAEWRLPPPPDGTVCLVLSQGDDQLGMPKPVMSIGQGTMGQCCYCGWMLNPIKKGDLGEIVEYAYSLSLKVHWGRLTVAQVRKLVRETTYKPDFRHK